MYYKTRKEEERRRRLERLLERIDLMVALSTCCFSKAAAFRAVILGAPASGKGTISLRIIEHFNIMHISSGDKLRLHVKNNTELGKEVKKYLDSGSFVPDETMISLIEKEIEAVGDHNWLLDGFPRTLTQAEKLQRIQPANLVLNLIVPTSVILNRVKNRWVHLPSGRIYNIGFNDPKVPGKDDVTGESLSQREDDKPEVVHRRLEEYSAKTKPVVDFYCNLGILKNFRGDTTDDIWPSIKECVEQFL
ncbi:GTP:AMP phosphotransferase AK3, mitochondrial [Vespa crabro]|uniref:GTP:AMP phosphotransferase AK3, mitochondrial n=1 Tax=Vespa crabro TaxID=7445 RepID=UPI001F00F6CA|nr:GTP:AMP phosphotransferase AK3, mitochondrial [Vespa crabro]